MFEPYEYDDSAIKVPVAIPYVLALRVTERCYTACAHCCLDARPSGAEISLARARSAIRQACNTGLRTIHLTGGEPLLHPQIEEIVGLARAADRQVEMVTSLFAPNRDPAAVRLPRLAAAGLERVLVSYDDWHARRVPLAELTAFLVRSRELGLDVAVNVVETEDAAWTCASTYEHCRSLFADADEIEWMPAQVSSVGRAARHGLTEGPGAAGARCAFSLTSPTVTPAGDVVVCCNVPADTTGLRLGHLDRDGLATCLERLASHPLARINAAHGPHCAWSALAARDAAPPGTCACCLALMTRLDDEEVQAKLGNVESTLPAELPLDVAALSKWYRRAIPADAPRTNAHV